MTLIGITLALALAGSLSYMSLMPERYMALNSMGFGFSGLISALLNALLLLIFGSEDSNEFARVMTFYALCFIIMTITASMYFVERKSDFAQFYISMATTEGSDKKTPKKCGRFTALWTNSKVAFGLAWPMLFQVFLGITLSFIVFPGVLQAKSVSFINS